jgi:hypothetical protein
VLKRDPTRVINVQKEAKALTERLALTQPVGRAADLARTAADTINEIYNGNI